MAQTSGYFQYYTAIERAIKVLGADISHFQYPMNFATMATQGSYVHMKSGGVTYSDKTCRYIKISVNGSNVNVSAVFNNLFAYEADLTEHAQGATVTASQPAQSGVLTSFTDGDPSTFVVVGDNLQWIKVDLGAVYDINFIQLHQYYLDSRIFHDKLIEYSTDDISYNTWYDGNIAGEFVERYVGMQIFGYSGQAVDVEFLTANITAARSAGLKVGAYWFKNPNYYDTGVGYHNTIADGVQEATQFYDWIVAQLSSSDLGDIMPMLDFENQNGNIYPAMTKDSCYDYIKSFVDTFKGLSGRQCILYTAYYTLEGFGLVTDILTKYGVGSVGEFMPIWLSAIDTGSYPLLQYIAYGDFTNDKWLNWQYSCTNGLASDWGATGTDIDLDVLDGDLDSIMPPEQITGVTTTAGDNTIAITWTLSTATDIDHYNIYLNSAKIRANSGPNSYTATNLISLQEYSVQVSAADLWEEGPLSAAVLATPTGIRAPSNKDGMFIDLSFNNTLNSVVVNNGTAFSYAQIRVTFSAAATNYKITDENGLYIYMLETFADEDVLFIDLQKQSVTLNGVNDMLHLDLSSRFFNIPIGISSYITTNTQAQTTQIILQEQYL